MGRRSRWWALVAVGVVLTGCGPAADGAMATTATSAAPRWQPEPGTSWQWQLSGQIDTAVDAEVFDVDLFDASDEELAALEGRGRRLICYVNAGAFEPWRDDAGHFDDVVLGAPMEGWPEERWLDVRRLDLLAPVLEDRLDRCAARGFDGVELDNVDAYDNGSGFPLTRDDQLAYNRFLAAAAHDRGLAVGLKNALGLVPDLVDEFDFAVNEECAAYAECEALVPFIEQGKAVLHVEYDLPLEAFCPLTQALGFSSLRKGLDLGPGGMSCAEDAP